MPLMIRRWALDQDVPLRTLAVLSTWRELEQAPDRRDTRLVFFPR